MNVYLGDTNTRGTPITYHSFVAQIISLSQELGLGYPITFLESLPSEHNIQQDVTVTVTKF